MSCKYIYVARITVSDFNYAYYGVLGNGTAPKALLGPTFSSYLAITADETFTVFVLSNATSRDSNEEPVLWDGP